MEAEICNCVISLFGLHVPEGSAPFPSCFAFAPFSFSRVLVLLLLRCRRCFIERNLNMASDGPPGTESLPSDLGSAIAALNTWSNPELQSKLAELGAPNMGPREELIDRLKGYMMQMPGIPPLPPMPMPPMPPGMGMLQAMSMMPGGPPPPGIHMGIEPQGDSRVMDEQDLLEQQKRAAVLLEQERQQEMAKMQGPGPRAMPPVGAVRGLDPRGPLPPGVSMLPTQKQRVPPPPGEDNREAWQNDEVSISGPKIPQALEKILQLKEIRQEQLTDPAEGEDDEDDEGADMDMNNSAVMSETEDDENQMSKKDKNRKRRNRKKKSKKKRAQEKKEQAEQEQKKEAGDKEQEPEVEIEYITEEPEIYDPNFIFFKRIFEAFKVRHVMRL
ncbi:hypothetical protein INR49_002847 [Caranx melampygus]|nr:hypothetical protein INR49_002847 [Caranx melampygus]